MNMRLKRSARRRWNLRNAVLASLLLALVAVCSFNSNRVTAQTSPTLRLVPVLSGLEGPLYVTSAHDGSNRLFVVEQDGRIKVLQPGASAPTVFLDITAKVLSFNEQGLLGLAFHPQFATNRRFFIDYIRRSDGSTVVAEYQVSATNGNVAELTEKILLVIAQPSASHKAGMLEFGPDGYMYIAVGDGGPARDPSNRAQNLNDLHGKILRIDVDHMDGDQPYRSPADNPFIGYPAPARSEVYAYGLRNPWRFSFDRETAALYAADVGQGAREEINLIQRGGNYGWRIFEGTLCTNLDPPLCATVQTIPPLLEYTHPSGRCAIIGGYVYRGTRASLPTGAYIYGDYCTGEILMLQNGAEKLLADTSLGITSFGEDEAGEIYVTGEGGTLHRLDLNPPPTTPFAIGRAWVRKRASGAVLDPISVRGNGKKFEIVVLESSTPTAASANATVVVNGIELATDYTSTETEHPIFVARLKGFMLATPGPLVVEVVRADGTRSNKLTLQVVP